MKKFIAFLVLFNITNNCRALDNTFYILKFPYNNISTNNLNIISDKMQIIWIKPINSNKLYGYNNFKNNYINDIWNNQLKIEYKISGILIDEIKVYTNIEKINQLNIENIKIIK